MIVHAAEDADVEDVKVHADHLLQQAQRTAAESASILDIRTRFVADNPAHAMIEASYNATMVVVGNRGHGGFHDLLLGSTSLHTAMHARCPVAVIRLRLPADETSADAAERIVVGVDGSKRSAVALDFAFAHAERTGRGVTAVHAWQGPITAGTVGMMPYVADSQEQHQHEEQLLSNSVRPWLRRYPQIDFRKVSLQMSPAAALVRQSMGAHLAVVGSRGLGGFSGLLLGSTGQALIHHAGCPVVIVHGHLPETTAAIREGPT